MWVRPQRKPIRLTKSGGIARGVSRRDELFDCQGFAPIGSPFSFRVNRQVVPVLCNRATIAL
jgi:hypothetical protein